MGCGHVDGARRTVSRVGIGQRRDVGGAQGGSDGGSDGDSELSELGGCKGEQTSLYSGQIGLTGLVEL